MWLIVTLAFATALLYYVFKRNYSCYWEERGVPTASGREWFFGHYKEVLLLKKHALHLNDEIYSEFPEAPVVGYYVLQYPALLIRHPEVIRTILVTKFNHYSSNGMSVDKKIDFLAGSNPFFSQGDEWKMTRAHATPALSATKLRGYLPSMFQVADEMVKYVRKHCQGSVASLELKDISTMFTADVMANAICGVETNTFEDRNSLFAHMSGEVSRLFQTSVLGTLQYFAVAAFPPLEAIFQTRKFTTVKLQRMLLSLTRKIIHERSINREKRNDIYQVMMGLRETDDIGVFTDEYISGHVFTILLDLFETSSNVLTATLFLLAWHTEYQDKLRSEILDLQSRTKEQYTIEDVETLKYLDMVLCESMRLHSPISSLSRECSKDDFLTIPGRNPLQITKGTPITIPISSVHMDPRYYPDPEKFDPERFSYEEIAKRPKFTFLPFAEGPRKCLGMRIGTLQIKIAVMSIIQNFKLKPCIKTNYPLDVDPRVFVLIRPTHGAWVNFEEILQNKYN